MKFDQQLTQLKARDPAQDFEPPSEVEIDAALATILGRAAAVERGVQPRHPWRRRGWLAVVATACAAAAALLLGVVLPVGVPAGAQNAWAKRVIARATAAALSGGDKPLYIKITDHFHQGGHALHPNLASVQAIWEDSQNTAMSDWALTPKAHLDEQLVETSDTGWVYEPRFNSLSRIRNYDRPADRTVYDPVFQGLLTIGAISNFKPTAAGPAEVRQAMAALLRQPGMAVTHAVLRGKPVIRLWHGHWHGVVYLDPKTYSPYEIYVGTKFDKNISTLIFDAYRTLTPSQLPVNVFNLPRQHPGMRVQ